MRVMQFNLDKSLTALEQQLACKILKLQGAPTSVFFSYRIDFNVFLVMQKNIPLNLLHYR